VALINVVLSMYIPLFGVFQGAGHSSFPTLVATCALGVRVIVTYLFRYSPVFGYSIIWWNGLFGFGLGFVISWGYYLSGKWRNNASLTGV
jgi:Na+-driven multidrug efflux pump